MYDHLPSWQHVAGQLAVLATCLVGGAGCQQKMADQPSFKPLEASSFFADGRSARPTVVGTVPRGHLRTDVAFFTGRVAGRAPQPLLNTVQPDTATTAGASADDDGDLPPGSPQKSVVPPAFRDDAAFIDAFPMQVGPAMLEHGRNRYTIYCAVCHDPLGTGHGRIIERGYTPPPSFHIDRLRAAPPGKLFAVVTEGYGSMPSYAGQIPPEDRWAIVAYMRALQLSQHYPRGELTSEMQNALASSNSGTANSSPNDTIEP